MLDSVWFRFSDGTDICEEQKHASRSTCSHLTFHLIAELQMPVSFAKPSSLQSNIPFKHKCVISSLSSESYDIS